VALQARRARALKVCTVQVKQALKVLLGAAQGRASGYLGSANALTGGLNTALNFYQQQQLLNALARNPSGMTYGGGG
jgi:hypothetical protein